MKRTDIAIIGGGLAGLTAAIHLARKKLRVTLYEKEDYPCHKVCGEYLSREVIPYLRSLSLDLSILEPVEITRLVYSTPSGRTVKAALPLGGIGISRYALDHYLMKQAELAGVEILNSTVTDVNFNGNSFSINVGKKDEVFADLVLGAFGKRSSLDRNMERKFMEEKTGWLAVKNHYKLDSYPSNTVSLHNFRGGYCGLSKTETGAVNVCYLATYSSFKKYKDPEKFRVEVLHKNPFLKTFFQNSTPLLEHNKTIAQIFFGKKSLVEDHILMLGDAAGMIHPLCGNGMAMAMHSARIASESILRHYTGNAFDRKALEKEYRDKWNNLFRSRLTTGKILQKILLNPFLAEASQNLIKTFPILLPQIITKTHGKPVA